MRDLRLRSQEIQEASAEKRYCEQGEIGVYSTSLYTQNLDPFKRTHIDFNIDLQIYAGKDEKEGRVYMCRSKKKQTAVLRRNIYILDSPNQVLTAEGKKAMEMEKFTKKMMTRSY